MGIWISMLVSVLLVPVIMIGAGNWLLNHPPKDINCLIGYRTRRSMKNRDTWDFAHRHIGNTWIKWGFIMLPATLAALFPTLGRGEEMICVIGLILLCAQTLVMLISIIPTERALKRTFTEDGERRDKSEE